MNEFSKTALLYAENAPTVDAVRKVFEQELSSYLDSLAERIRAELLPLTFQEEITGKYRYWWIGPGGSRRNDHLRFWFTSNDPAIVHPGELILKAYHENVTAKTKSRIVALSINSPIQEYSTPGKVWSILDVVIRITPDDLIVGPTKQICEALKQLSVIDHESDAEK